ncbi:hypothetical protein ACQKND_11660 [Viridibacillus arvi]|uniref:hypothetical protein n=1 Tax=Viridibacillus arvi TaxID=263475 RepID=UPI003D06B881
MMIILRFHCELNRDKDELGFKTDAFKTWHTVFLVWLKIRKPIPQVKGQFI